MSARREELLVPLFAADDLELGFTHGRLMSRSDAAALRGCALDCGWTLLHEDPDFVRLEYAGLALEIRRPTSSSPMATLTVLVPPPDWASAVDELNSFLADLHRSGGTG